MGYWWYSKGESNHRAVPGGVPRGTDMTVGVHRTAQSPSWYPVGRNIPPAPLRAHAALWTGVQSFVL